MKTYERADVRNTLVGMLRKARWSGMTSKEAREQIGHHHGAVSGALTTLHKQGRVARLTEKTDNYLVYVLPEFVDGRETEDYAPRRRVCKNCGETF